MFKSHVSFSLLMLLVFIFLGTEASKLVIRKTGQHYLGSSPVFLAKLIDRMFPEDPIRSMALIESANQGTLSRRLWLLDQEGRVLYPPGTRLSHVWKDLPHPEASYSFVPLEPSSFPPSRTGMVRLQGSTPRFLFVESDTSHSSGWKMFQINLFFLVLAAICGSSLSIWFLYWNLKSKARIADKVISELQHGNLKARFPITRMDEFGQAMLRFNQMADEIERLVEHLRTVENSRRRLLGELAHDLRTPLASLKSMLETVSDRGDQLPGDIRDEFVSLSLKEVDYFAGLVEDFLFLAQVSEPRYRAKPSFITISSVLRAEIDSLERLYPFKTVELTIPARGEAWGIIGDSHLLKRLFRNALDNALSFAVSCVSVRLDLVERNSVEIAIRDDGPGLTQSALKSFGERRLTRSVGASRTGRLSVGLGSVIIKEVVSLHRGDVCIVNCYEPNGRVVGAELKVKFPLEISLGIPLAI